VVMLPAWNGRMSYRIDRADVRHCNRGHEDAWRLVPKVKRLQHGFGHRGSFRQVRDRRGAGLSFFSPTSILLAYEN